jgi:hypothetical protein
MSQAEYGDPLDVAMLSVPLGLWQQWADFEAKAYETVVNDPRQKFRTLINAGAGRRISENDMPFVERFDTVYLLEPDAGRRRLLAESLEKTPRLRENVIGTRLEELDARQVPQFDFVLCKYVLQHIRTDLMPAAAAKLVEITAADGALGIFSAHERTSRFEVLVPASEFARVPSNWAKGMVQAGNAFTKPLVEKQFNELLTEPQDFSFVTTHFLGTDLLGDLLSGLSVRTVTGPTGEVFLYARK